MRVVITKTFKKKYLKKFSKYFSGEDFIGFLKEKNHTFIGLHHPYFKIKGNIKTIAIRGMLFFLEKDKIIPLMIFLKKDKKYGENINWEAFEDNILSEYKNALEDIRKRDFETY